jgi:hypothetical protein
MNDEDNKPDAKTVADKVIPFDKESGLEKGQEHGKDGVEDEDNVATSSNKKAVERKESNAVIDLTATRSTVTTTVAIGELIRERDEFRLLAAQLNVKHLEAKIRYHEISEIISTQKAFKFKSKEAQIKLDLWAKGANHNSEDALRENELSKRAKVADEEAEQQKRIHTNMKKSLPVVQKYLQQVIAEQCNTKVSKYSGTTISEDVVEMVVSNSDVSSGRKKRPYEDEHKSGSEGRHELKSAIVSPEKATKQRTEITYNNMTDDDLLNFENESSDAEYDGWRDYKP